MEKLAKALDPVAKKLEKVGEGFARLPANILSAGAASKQFANETRGLREAI
jgi:hypothetical protein